MPGAVSRGTIMAFEITINDTLINDQTAGLQDGDDAIAADLLALAAPFRTALQALAGPQVLTAGQLAYAASVEGAISGAGYVTVNNDGATVTDLFFSNSSGALFTGEKVVYDGNDLKTIDGDNIYLHSIGDGDIVLATTSATAGQGKVVAAFYLDDTGTNNLSASIQMVTFIALDHPDDTDNDDRVDWTDLLNVTATGSLFFDFDALKSGSSLWVAVGSEDGGVLVTGGNPQVAAGTNKKTNASDVIHTSQGGDGTTIGVNNQLFDNVGEKGVFTLVTGLDTITGDDGATGDYTVDPNLNDAKLEGIDYDGYLNVTGAGIYISQSQGSPAVTKDFDITLYSAGGGTTPEDLTNYIPGLASDASVAVGSVTVINDDGEVVGVWGVGGVASGTSLPSDSANGITNVTVTISGNNIDINGVFGEFTVRWTSAGGATFNRFVLTSEAGQFDVGAVEITQGFKSTEPIGDSLFVDDDGPTLDLALNGTPSLTVDETSLGAEPPVAPTASISAASLLSTITESFGTDGQGAAAAVYKLLLTDDNSGLTDTATDDEVLLTINAAGTLITGSVEDGGPQTVFTIAIDPATGQVTLTQYRALKNPDTGDPDEDDDPLTLPNELVYVEKTITDKDDDEASDSVDISSIFKFEDDGPNLGGVTDDPLDLITDDDSITMFDTVLTDDIFIGDPVYGADGPHAVTPLIIQLKLSAENADSGLVDTETGDKILFKTVGTSIIGYVDNNGDGSIGLGETTEAIRYDISADKETVTFTQIRAVYHAKPGNDTEETVNANTVTVERIAIDGDGDQSDVDSFDLGAITKIGDDEPVIGPIPDGLVNFAAGTSVNKSLGGDVGNDPNASPYTLTSYTLNLTTNGIDLQAVAVGDDEVGYWADTNNDDIFGNTGDTLYYRMKLGDQGGAGDYTFSVYVNPPPALTEFNFDDLPSGSNLFGIVGDADAGLIIFGETIGLKADNTYIANQTQEVKTSQAGLHDTIGIESQMFDPGDAAYFTFVTNPDPNYTGLALGSTEADDADNILYGATLEGETAFIKIAQLQGNTAPKMSIELFNIDDTNPQGVFMLDARGENETGKDPDVIAVRVYAADGTTLLESFANGVEAGLSSSITIAIGADGVATVEGFGENYRIEWDADEDFDQTLISGLQGKFDIGGFGFVQANDTPDQFLQFTAQVTDGDGDTDTDSWNIGIDGTGEHDDDHVDNVVAVI